MGGRTQAYLSYLYVHAYTARQSEPIHVVLGFRLLVHEAHSLFWLISASINGSTPSILLHALRLRL